MVTLLIFLPSYCHLAANVKLILNSFEFDWPGLARLHFAARSLEHAIFDAILISQSVCVLISRAHFFAFWVFHRRIFVDLDFLEYLFDSSFLSIHPCLSSIPVCPQRILFILYFVSCPFIWTIWSVVDLVDSFRFGSFRS